MPLEPAEALSSADPDRKRVFSTLGEHLCGVFLRHEVSAVASILLTVILLSARISRVRPLWFDELFTVLVAGQPTLHDFALAMPPEANPPLDTFAVRLLLHPLGATALAVRLPSMLAFAVACLAVYLFVRRRTGPVAGLFALAFMLFQPAWSYAYEGRPYALLLCFMSLTLLAWQAAASGVRPRALPLAGMSLALAGAMLSHHLGLAVVGFPILLGEVSRLYRSRRPDWPLYATFLIALPVLAFTLPMARRTREQLLILAIAHQPPMNLHIFLDWLRGLKFTLPGILSIPSLLACAVLIALLWRPRASSGPLSPAIPVHEVAAAVGAALLIPVTLLIMVFSSNYYNPRYGIGCIAGFAILCAFGLSRTLAARQDILAALILMLGGAFLLDAQARLHAPPAAQTLPAIPSAFAGEAVATTNVFAFYPAWWYSPAGERQRLHFLLDMPSAVKDNNAIPEMALMLEQGRLDAHLDRLPDFTATHTRFVAYIPAGPGIELRERLLASGYTLTPIPASPTLFEATR